MSVYRVLNRGNVNRRYRPGTPSTAASGDIKNMSRIQLREYGLLENDENSRKSSCAPDKYLQATRLSLYFLVCSRRDSIYITDGRIAIRKYILLKTFVV